MEKKLFILHTNDIHSFFEQMPKIASVIDQRKAEHSPDEVLVIDCGDHMDRMRMETEGTGGLANIEIMNETGYEFAVLGNNEGLTFTADIIAKAYGNHARFTALGSNFYDMASQSIPPWLAPYHIVEKNGIRIGLIGVTANFTVFYEQLGWDVRDPMAVTKELVRKLRPQADIIVVISHLGLPNDQHMAEEIPGIDCIFGGHTHHLLTEPLRIGDTYIFGAGKFGKYVGEAEIHFDAERRVITSVTGRCIDVDPYPSAARIVRTIARNQALSQQNLSEAVAWLRQPLEIDWRGESILGNLLAAGIKKWTKAEIGIVNAGQIIGGLNAGEITREMLLKVCPSPINPCRMWVTGRQIWKALEESLLPEFVDKAIRGFGFRGQVLGTLCLDGLHVEYDPTRKSYEKITGIWVNGQSLDKEREYLVGTIDMFTFGVGYTSLQAGRDLRFYLPEFIRDILQQQLQNQEEISRVHEIHWLKR